MKQTPDTNSEVEQEALSQNNSTWRDWWFVKHVLSEFPIIDGVCRCRKGKDIFYYSSRSTIALIIGTTVMMANLFDMKESDPMLLQAVKMAAGMGLGMASGTITHNLMSFFVEQTQQSCRTTNELRSALLGNVNAT